jgi:hypothetical protein
MILEIDGSYCDTLDDLEAQLECQERIVHCAFIPNFTSITWPSFSIFKVSERILILGYFYISHNQHSQCYCYPYCIHWTHAEGDRRNYGTSFSEIIMGELSTL